MFYNDLKKIKNKHQGESCFLFGDGPSIKYFDLSKFDKHIGISCGMQAFHKDFSKLNIKYYSLIEPFLFYPDWLIIFKKYQYLKKHTIIVEEFKNIIKESQDITFFVNLSNIPVLRGRNVSYVHKILVDKNEELYFKENSPFSGSFHSCLYLAFLMGFSKIYMVGFDGWTRQPMLSKRWYEKGRIKYKKINNLEHEIFDFLNKRIDIYNVSLDGTACNINNILYEDYCKQKPFFKEAKEIINPTYFSIIEKRLKNGY